MDTGRAGTIGGRTAEQALGKSFFAKNGWLPKFALFESLHTWPARDFTNLSTGALTANTSRLRASGLAGSAMNWGWNFGADYTKALIILPWTHGNANRFLLFVGDGAPNTNQGAGCNAYGFRCETFGAVWDIGRWATANGWNNGSSWTQMAVAGTANIYSPNASKFENMGMALYVDTAADVVKGFMRMNTGCWIPVAEVSDNNWTKTRTAGILAAPSSTDGTDFMAPIGVYYE